MADLPQTVIEMPLDCPRCKRKLYPIAHLRPQPTYNRAGRAMLILAGVAMALIEVIVASALREHLAVREAGLNGWQVVRYPPTAITSLAALPVALIPGLAIGYFASRLPRVRRLRCKQCRWWQHYPVSARWERPRDSSDVMTKWAAAAIADPDEPWARATVWAFAELREGRLAENVAADLIEQGWPPEDVEIMVEAQRRAARPGPAALRRAR